MSRRSNSRNQRFLPRPLWRMAIMAAVAAIAVISQKKLPHSASDDYEKYNQLTAVVTKVVDGDTLDIDVYDDHENSSHTRIRLLGIDTPETKRPNTPVQHFGPQAYKKTKQLALGKEVTLILPDRSHTRGSYGRLLAYIQLPDGAMLNKLLVSEGYAYADPRFSHPHLSDFKAEMSIAKREKRGLWQDVSDSDLPYYLK